ncbi:MAG: hemerythrin domain-containing protein [Bacteroidales bacterium]|nr:hemerythrin domain-containing protein [Bacteroidales bacterium]
MTTLKKTIQRDVLFSEQMRLADLIDLNYHLLPILSRLGVSVSLSDHTVADACAKSDVDVATLLLVCNVYTFDDYVPSGAALSEGNPTDIIKYLHNSHSYYLEDAVIAMQEDICKLLEPCGEKQQAVIWKFFNDYKAELDNHFGYEEKVVFPYVASLLRGEDRKGFSIAQFEDNHSNISEALNDLKNIIMKYLPAECSDALRNRLLIAIYRLDIDLVKHTRIEDNILVPIVTRIEENGRQ